MEDSMDLALSYFRILPNELLITILQELNSVEVINFCEAYPEFEYFFSEKKLINIVDLSRRTGFEKVPSFINIIGKFRAEYITVFNITCIYWISAVELRRCLRKLKNLEELYLLGTKVGLTIADCQSYKSLKLKKLGVTIEDEQIKKSKAAYFKNVTSLCIQITTKKDFTFQYRLQCLIKALKNLEELWIHDVTDSFPLDYDHIAYTGTNLKIFAFKALYSMFSDLRFKGLTRVFFNEKTGREAYYEKIEPVSDPRSLAKTTSWKVLNEFHSETPYGLQDAKKLAHGKTTINDIIFKELNFKHSTNQCNPRYSTAIREIIVSKNASEMKNVTITNCLFLEKPLVCKHYTHNSRKRSRIDYIHEPTEEQKIVINNFKYLKKLEIYACARYEGFKMYYLIQHFRNIVYLALEIPGTLNGEFFKQMLENCKLIETLKINVVVSNESFNNDFYRYIHLAKNLKNLRYQHYRISMENLFGGLNNITMPKMERLFFKCKYVDNFGISNFKEFLKLNPNLDFAVIIMNSATDKMIKSMLDQMKPYKSSEKTFLIKKIEDVCVGQFPVSSSHIELITPHSTVCNLNIFDDFYKS